MKENNQNIELTIAYILEELSDSEKRKFNEWLQESEENGKLYQEIKSTWDLTSVSNPKTSFSTEEGWHDFKEKRDPAKKKYWKLSILKIAASLVVAWAIGALSFYYISKSPLLISEDTFIKTVVPNGSMSEIYLSDGSRVWLNAGTTIKYPPAFSLTERTIYLEGEAYFDVVTNPDHPFVVNAGKVKIKALGTSFNVKAYSSDDIVETTLIKGKVVITDREQNKAITLQPNQKLTIMKKDGSMVVDEITREKSEAKKITRLESKETRKIYLEEKIDPKPVISWKEQEWFISGENLESLAVKLERRYNVNISFSDENLKKYRFTGTIQDESLEQVLNYMGRVSPIKYKIDGKNVIFSENKKFLEKYQEMLKK